jgi:hypothetical protein
MLTRKEKSFGGLKDFCNFPQFSFGGNKGIFVLTSFSATLYQCLRVVVSARVVVVVRRVVVVVGLQI